MRLAYETANRYAKQRHRAAEQADRQQEEHDQRRDVDRPHQLGRVDVVEVRPDRSGRCRARARAVGVVAGHVHVVHQLLRQVAVLAEEAVQIERPHEVRVEQHRAGQDADRRERGGAGGREPELVPRFPDFTQIVASGGDHRGPSRPAASRIGGAALLPVHALALVRWRRREVAATLRDFDLQFVTFRIR